MTGVSWNSTSPPTPVLHSWGKGREGRSPPGHSVEWLVWGAREPGHICPRREWQAALCSTGLMARPPLPLCGDFILFLTVLHAWHLEGIQQVFVDLNLNGLVCGYWVGWERERMGCPSTCCTVHPVPYESTVICMHQTCPFLWLSRRWSWG